MFKNRRARWILPAAVAATTAAGSLAVVAWSANADNPDKAADDWEVVYGGPEEGGQYTAVAAADGQAWAFGNEEAQDDVATRIVHYDGEEWSEQPAPDGLTISPSSAVATAADDVWASGYDQENPGARLLHFDGSEWTVVEDAPDGIKHFQPIARDDVWTFNSKGDEEGRTAYHFDGESWSEKPVPEYGGPMSVSDDGTLYAVGSDADDQPTVEQWDGQEWSLLESAEVDLDAGCNYAGFSDMVARSEDDLWAAGSIDCMDSDENEYQKSLLGHWNGEEWTVEVGEDGTTFESVAEDGDGGIWLTDVDTYVHRTADGEVTESRIGDGGVYSLALARLDGTTMVGAGTRYEEADPEEPQEYGFVLGYGM